MPIGPTNDVPRFSATLDAVLRNLANTGRGRKQAVTIAVDTCIVVGALWLAYTLRHGQPFSDFYHTWYVFVLLPLCTVLIFGGLGIYRWVIRSTNHRLFRQLVKGSVLSAVALTMIFFLLPPDRPNARSLFVIYGMLLIVGSTGVRLLWRELFDVDKRGEPVAIFGAGLGGQQLVSLLMTGGQDYHPVVFIDDNPAFAGSTIGGLPVVSGRDPDLKSRLKRFDVDRVVLAMPSIGRSVYEEKLEQMALLDLRVQTMPSITELMTGNARPDDIRDVSIKDILGRTEIAADVELMGRRVSGRQVLVTGGGGSIGSELCRQILDLGPSELVILDSCEANLYHITEELQSRLASRSLESGTEAVGRFTPLLGSVTDRARMDALMQRHAVETVFHAAAYKHVPIIESQPEQGVDTNVFGTLAVLQSAIEHGVRDFVLISTDKAVRPTNSMGASKRVAEMILQAHAAMQKNTRICMVRFGNVLGSSGSVVPKFKRQIQAGGPVTITHPDITRYFMTIPEAAQLVLQASAIAKGGDVFVLDMGEPVRILDLAETMIRLYGKQLQRDTGNSADIEIRVDGLRPGEKMYEELFINESHRRTDVAKIFTADESLLPWDELRDQLDMLRVEADSADAEKLRHHLLALSASAYRPTAATVTMLPSRSAAANDAEAKVEVRPTKR